MHELQYFHGYQQTPTTGTMRTTPKQVLQNMWTPLKMGLTPVT